MGSLTSWNLGLPADLVFDPEASELSDITPLLVLFNGPPTTTSSNSLPPAQTTLVTTIRQEDTDCWPREHDIGEAEGDGVQYFVPLSCSSPQATENPEQDNFQEHANGEPVQACQDDGCNAASTERVTEGTRKRARTEHQKIANFANKHKVKPPPKACHDECRKRCTDISEGQRQAINTQVNGMSLPGRRQWYRCFVEEQTVTKRRDDKTEKEHRKNMTMTWSLPTENKTNVPVCKGFFLATLGFTPTNAQQVTTAVREGDVCSQAGTSGGHAPGNKVNVDATKATSTSSIP